MERIKFINYKDHIILMADYSHSSPDEMFDLIELMSSILKDQSPGATLVLEDVTGVRFNSKVIDKRKLFWSQNKDRVKRTALVGVEGLLTIAHYDVESDTMMQLPTFPDLDSAKEWLIHDE